MAVPRGWLYIAALIGPTFSFDKAACMGQLHTHSGALFVTYILTDDFEETEAAHDQVDLLGKTRTKCISSLLISRSHVSINCTSRSISNASAFSAAACP